MPAILDIDLGGLLGSKELTFTSLLSQKGLKELDEAGGLEMDEMDVEEEDVGMEAGGVMEKFISDEEVDSCTAVETGEVEVIAMLAEEAGEVEVGDEVGKVMIVDPDEDVEEGVEKDEEDEGEGEEGSLV